MQKIFKAVIFIISVSMASIAFADSISDIGEVYTAEAVPGKTDSAPSEFHGLLGAGLFNFEKTVGESGRRTVLLPIFVMTYQDWAYWSFGSGGVWLYQSEDREVKFGIGLKAHRGYTEDDDPVYAGMSTRRNSLDGSINALWKTDIVNTSVHYYHDLGKASKGDTATLKFSHAFVLSPRLRLIPNVGAEWISAAVVDYYYGVTVAEATASRPVYTGQSTVSYSAGLNTTYLLNRSWLLMGGVNYSTLGSGIVESPLVTNSKSVVVYLGATWLF